MDQQTSILKKTPGINNLFHSHVRRSRSLASLQKAFNEDMRSHSAMSNHRPSPDAQPPTGLRPQLKTAKTVHSLEAQGMMTRKWFANTSVMATPQNSRTPSPPSRPKPAPRLWTEYDDEPDIKPSLLGLDTMLVPRSQYAPPNYQLPPRKPVGQMTVGSAPSAMGSPNPMYAQQQRAQSPRAMKSSRSPDTSVSRRRKPSVADLNLDTLSTVTEWSHDSPTFRMARSSRNHSDPAAVAAAASMKGKNEALTPRANSTDPTTKFPNAESSSIVLAITTPMATKRASSMLLPIALAPLITSSPPQLDYYPADLESEEDRPPVPPKSPRYTKASPQHRRPPPPKQRSNSTAGSNVSSVMHSANSSFSELSHAMASTATTLSPIELPSVWPDKGIEALNSPQLSPKSLHLSPQAPQLSLFPLPKKMPSTLPWVMKEFVPSKRRPQHGHSASEIVIASPPIVAAVSATPPSATSIQSLIKSPGHQRNYSDSVLNRGRPTKRSLHKHQRSASRELTLAQMAGTLDDLPQGHVGGAALAELPQAELADLRYDAEREAKHFETVSFSDVRNLKKELDLLEELVAQLRRKTLSLRDSRKALHGRLISFLKAPGNALVSREHVVKQDTELAELDATIDEATTKLEAAQERRNKVQRKLLEHTCAMLVLRMPSGPAAEQTPPQSPEDDGEEDEQDDADKENQSVQSANPPESLVIDINEGDELESTSPGTADAFEDLLDDYDRTTVYNPWHDSYGSGSAKYRESSWDGGEWPAAAEASDDEEEELEREEREYTERMARERAASVPGETGKRGLVEMTQRQQQHAFSQKEEMAAEPEDTAEPEMEAPLLLGQGRYEPPPPRNDSLALPTEAASRRPAAAAAKRPAHARKASISGNAAPTPQQQQAEGPAASQSPRQELVQSIQIYADEGVYTGHQGMEGLLSSIEQEIDDIDRQRSMSVFAA